MSEASLPFREPVPPPSRDAPDGAWAVLRAAGHGHARGVADYQRYLDLVADQVSPGEAEQARTAFTTARNWLLLALAFWLALQAALLTQDPWLTPWQRRAADDCLAAYVLLVSLALASGCGVSYAGRILFALQALAMPPDFASIDWQASTWQEVAFALRFLAAFGAGAIVDFGADTGLGRSWPRARRATLAAAGAAAALALVALWRQAGDDRPFPTASVVACLVAAGWCWWPAPRLARWRRAQSPDAALVLATAHRRWGRLIAGRALAVLVGLGPTLMFLCTLGLEGRLSWPAEGDGLFRPAVDGEREALFWRTQGRFLQPHDLEEHAVYAVPANAPHEVSGSLAELLPILAAEQTGPAAEAAFGRLETVLASYRIHSADALPATGAEAGLIHLEHVVPPDSRPGPAVFHARPFDGRWLRRQQASSYVRLIDFNVYPYLVFLLFGLLTLWRRGGDSPTARWVALWLIGTTTYLLIPFQELYLAAVEHELWRGAFAASRPSRLALGGLHVVGALQHGLWLLHLAGLPLAGIWVHLGWPSRIRADRPLARWTTNGLKMAVTMAGLRAAQLVVFLVGVAALFVGLTALFTFGGVDPEFTEGRFTDVAAMVLLNVTSALASVTWVGAVWLARRRTAAWSEFPLLTWRPAAAFVLSQFAVLLLFPYAGSAAGLMDDARAVPFSVVSWGAGTAALAGCVVLGTYALLRDNFLRLSAVRDTSAIAVAFVLPLAFEALEQVADRLLSGTSAILRSQTGTSIVSVLVVVLVFGPLWRILERLFLAVAVPQARHVQRRVAEALERLACQPPGAPCEDELARLFADLGAEGYAFYARSPNDAFGLTGAWLFRVPPAEVELSAAVREYLAERPRFHDLAGLAYEWRYFFFQFELTRLGRAVGCRYLLPVTLGPSLRGLLFLPEGPAQERISRDALAGDLASVGLQAAALGSPAGPGDERLSKRVAGRAVAS
jgi:hypothetical protein